MTSSPLTGGSEHAAFYKELNERQDARKASLEQRGMAVITTSGVLASLLFGLVAVVTEATAFELPVPARGPLALALLAFTGAAVLALFTNVPLFYKNVKITDPAVQFWPFWGEPHDDALQRITGTRIDVFQRAQLINDIKAWMLLAALAAEVTAVGALAVAVGEVLRYA